MFSPQVPKSILRKLKSLIFDFLWGSTGKERRYHFADWSTLSKPTSQGGWGIKNLEWFSTSLRLKSLWLALCGNGLWFKIISVKYLKKDNVISWIREKAFTVSGASVIWKGFISTITWLGKGLIWMAGNGENIKVGVDPISGMGSCYVLPLDLRIYLEDYGITTLAQARNCTKEASNYWLTAVDLDLSGNWHSLWDDYVSGLEQGRIRLKPSPDHFLWNFRNYTGSITAAMVYDCLVEHLKESDMDTSDVLQVLWKYNIPEKIRCFTWLLIKNKVLTWDQLIKRGFQGPSCCQLCRKEEETA